MQRFRTSAAVAVLLTLSALPTRAQESRSAAPPAAAQPDDAVELVGPTPAQKARSDAAAQAQAAAKAEARQRAEAQAKAQAEAELRAKQEAETRAKDTAAAQVRAQQEAKERAKEDAKAAVAAEKKAKADAAAQARADAIAAKKAKVEAAAQARRDAIAAKKAEKDLRDQAFRNLIAKRKADAAAKKQAAKDAKARAAEERAAAAERKRHPNAVPVSKPVVPAGEAAAATPAPLPSTPSDEGSADLIGRHDSNRVGVRPAEQPAALPPPPLPSPASPPATPSAAPAPAAPGYVDAAAHMRAKEEEDKRAALCRQARKKNRRGTPLPDVCKGGAASPDADTQRADELPLTGLDGSSAPSAVESAPPPRQNNWASAAPAPLAQPPAPPAADEGTQRPRTLRARDEFLIGPSGLFTNELALGGDMAPDFLAILFLYRYVADASGGHHHALLVNLGGAPCDDNRGCSFRVGGLVGFSPTGRSTYSVSSGGNLRTDSLNWSAVYLGANMRARADFGLGFDAGLQLENLSMDYGRATNTQAPQLHDGSLGQLRLWGALSYQQHGGGFGVRMLLSGNAYVSGDTGQSGGAPLQGVFYDPEFGGLATAPQGFLFKLETGYSFSAGFGMKASYGYQTYAGIPWAGAHLLALRLTQKLGAFQLGLGIAEQLDLPSAMPAGKSATDYGSLYVNGSVGVAF